MVIEYITSNYKGQTPLFLGADASSADINSCTRVNNEGVHEVKELYCTHEEADDRLIFHVHQCVVIEGATRALVATEDTDVIVSLMYHYLRW